MRRRHMNMPSAITARQPESRRRPTLSATPPRTTSRSPSRRLPSRERCRARRARPHSRAMPGPAKLIDATSNPSSAFSATVMAITATCSALIGALAISSRGSAAESFMSSPSSREASVCRSCGAGFRQRVEHLDASRHFVIDESILQYASSSSAETIRSRFSATNATGISRGVVLHADRRHFERVRMRVEHFVHLAWIDVVAAGDD